MHNRLISRHAVVIAALLLLSLSCGGDPEQSAATTVDSGGGGHLGLDTSGVADGNQSGVDTGGSGGQTTDTAAGADSGHSRVADTTTADSGTTQLSDSGAPDSASGDADNPNHGGTDGATTTDTLLPDTAGPDTASVAPPDAGAPDAGAPDAGAPDAGAPDAGAPDAGAPDAGAPVPVVRFAVLGDTGTGTVKQYEVGKVLAEHCKKHGCDFVMLLGDNFYDTGVKDENDQQFVDKFEKPYKDVNAPFYVVLGNHDYGAGGAGTEFMKKDFYLKYAKKNPKFVMPHAYWQKQIKHVHLFAMDSNSMLYGNLLKFIVADQIKYLDKAIAASTAQWKISFAHHPVRSNGPHGNAGCYEGATTALVPALCGIIPVASGKGVLDSYNKLVCGRMDIHFSGHDHGRQWLKKSASTKYCKGVELIVSGGGAKTTSVASKSKGGFEFNPVHYQDAQTPGFFYAEIKGDTFTGYFVDMNGKQTAPRSFKQGQ